MKKTVKDLLIEWGINEEARPRPEYKVGDVVVVANDPSRKGAIVKINKVVWEPERSYSSGAVDAGHWRYIVTGPQVPFGTSFEARDLARGSRAEFDKQMKAEKELWKQRSKYKGPIDYAPWQPSGHWTGD